MERAKPFRIVIGIILTSLLGIAVTSIFTGTYMIPIEMWQFSIFTITFAVVFVILHMNKRRWISLATFLVFLAIIGLFMYADTFGIRGGAYKIYDYLRYKFTGNLPYVSRVEYSQDSIAMLFAFYSLLPTFFMTRSLVRQKAIWPALLFYGVLFGGSVLVSSNQAPFFWYVVFGFSLIILLIFECMRKGDSEACYVTLTFLTLPVFAICLILCAIFPVKNYKMDEIATKQYDVVLTTVDSFLGTDLKRYLDESDVESYSPQSTKTKVELSNTLVDLEVEGKKTNEGTPLFNIHIDLFDGVNEADIGKIYLRNASMSEFSGSTWKRAETPYNFTKEPFPNLSNYSNTASGGEIIVFPLKSFRFSPIPCNGVWDVTDRHNYLDQNFKYENDQFADFIPSVRSSCAEEFFYPEYKGQNAGVTKAMLIRKKSDVSIPPPVFDQGYLDYVYNDCTFVPESTYDAILATGELPDWFLPVLNGEIEMTDDEKVTAVMYYVYKLAPYSMDTEYSPEGEDFVAWFISSARSGYCVHYATTAAILLRMLGVPTRYVSGYSLPYPIETELISDMYLVTDNDAHAWCEFFSPEYGWVGFDPTNNRFVDGPRAYTPAPNIVETEDFQRELQSSFERIETFTDEEFEDPEEVVEKNFLTGRAFILLIVIIIVTLLAIRIGKMISLQRSFAKGTNNSRVRALYRYAMYLHDHSELLIPSKMTDITEIAMYSRDGVTDEQVSQMTIFTREYLNAVLNSKSILKRIWAELIYVVTI